MNRPSAVVIAARVSSVPRRSINSSMEVRMAVPVVPLSEASVVAEALVAEVVLAVDSVADTLVVAVLVHDGRK